MSALAAKLSRLRVQAGISVGATVGAAQAAKPFPSVPEDREVATELAPASGITPRPIGPLPESIRRLLGIRTRALAPAPPAREPDRTLPGTELAPGLHYRELRFDWLPAPDTFDASFARDFAHVARRDVLAFDTETTGLAGGTGTRAFMIGVADWVEEPGRADPQECVATGVAATNALHLRVRQLFLTQMRGEAAMLEAFAQWLAPSTVLVSYNGRCYDAPLLEARYRLARQRSPLAALRHLDLLFPTRRRYKGRWENCRLATIERQVLGVVREDDLPGSEAPGAWLRWLRGGDAGDLRRVLAHNDQDVRSLLRLLVRLAEPQAASPPPL